MNDEYAFTELSDFRTEYHKTLEQVVWLRKVLVLVVAAVVACYILRRSR